MIVYKTDQYDLFRCTAADCPYTCCARWNIEIDEKTDRYYQTLDTEFGRFLNESIDRSSGRSLIKLDKNGCCPLLSPEGLCRVQMELGAAGLSNLCRDYPRLVFVEGGFVTQVTSSACVEVARELLTHEEPLRLLRADIDLPEAEAELSDTVESERGPLLERALQTSVRLLQDEKLDIGRRQRLFLLFHQALRETLRSDGTARTEALLAVFSDPAQYRGLLLGKDESPFELSTKVRIFKELCDVLMVQEASIETAVLFNYVLNYLLSIENDAAAQKQVREYFARLDTGKHAREQENVLVDRLLKGGYLGKAFDGDVYLQAAYIVVYNQLLRVFSAFGSARKGALLPVDRRARYLSAISKGFEHNGTARKRFQAKLRGDGLLELPFLLRLIS